AAQTVYGRDVHDLAVLLCAQDGRDSADHVERAGQVRVEHVLPFVIVHAPERAIPCNAGVVDEDVQTGECLVGLGDERVHGFGIAHVAGAAHDRDLHVAQFGGSPFGLG